jgi:hypothetical protein
MLKKGTWPHRPRPWPKGFCRSPAGRPEALLWVCFLPVSEIFPGAQKFNHFLEFFLGLIDSRYISEGDLGIALAKILALLLLKDMTPIPGPIFFMANRQIRKKIPRGRIHERRLLKNLFSCRPE